MTERGWLTVEVDGRNEIPPVMECLLEWLQLGRVKGEIIDKEGNFRRMNGMDAIATGFGCFM